MNLTRHTVKCTSFLSFLPLAPRNPRLDESDGDKFRVCWKTDPSECLHSPKCVKLIV